MYCAGKKCSSGNNHASTRGAVAGGYSLLKSFGAVFCSTADCAKIGNWEVAIRENRRLDSSKDLWDLRPGIVRGLIGPRRQADLSVSNERMADDRARHE